MCKSNFKRLFFDIETSFNIGSFWQASRKTFMSADHIIKERAIICICYKWESEDEVHYLTWDRDWNNPFSDTNAWDDKELLLRFMEVANSADELVAHNGDKFDLPWLRTRCFYHRIPMFPKYNTVDTYKHAKYYFKFNSNRLDYIGKFAGVGQKIQTPSDLWGRVCLQNNSDAVEEMIEYCKQDVRLLENVFTEMKNYFVNSSHVGVLAGKEKWSCVECGSTNVNLSKTRTTASGTIKRQMNCKDCGKYYTISNQAYKKYLTV